MIVLSKFIRKMTDTPQAIKDLQLKIWLSKSPGERLHQLMKDNEEIFKFWAALKEQNPTCISNQKKDDRPIFKK